MENEDKVAKRIAGNRTKRQQVKELHERKNKERAEAIALIKANYQEARENPVILDIISKARNFAAYHTKLAQDAVGYRATKAGQEPEMYRFTPAERVAELDKAAGNLEILDYIERMLKIDKETLVTSADAENSDEQDELESIDLEADTTASA